MYGCHSGSARSHNELLRGIITGDARERDLEITCYCDLDRVPIAMHLIRLFELGSLPDSRSIFSPLHVVASLQLDIHIRRMSDFS